MKEEWWLSAAVSDDTLVAELLLRLKDSCAAAAVNPLPPPTWGARQPRSSVEKKRDARRRSPTTPLSWGGGGSPSECYDDSSSHHADHPPRSYRFRSKVSPSTESQATSSKRHTRKKTFAELKDEEGLLLKERTCLTKELEILRLTLVGQRSMNDNLKRRKLDLPVESGATSEANSIEPRERNAIQNEASEATSNISKQVECEEQPSSCSSQQRGPISKVPTFMLPDLNMMPDEVCGQEGIVEMS